MYTYATLVNQQTAIGWHNLLRGHFSLQWQTIQNAFIHTRGETSHKTARWTNTVIDTIWSSVHQLWLSRNVDRHGNDQTTRLQAQTDQAIRELYIIYDHIEDYSPDVSWLLQTPIEDRLTMRPADLQQWLHTWGPLLESKR